MPPKELCLLDEIPDNSAKGMIAVIQGKQRNIFIARRGKMAYAYLNWCPHTQVLIDQIPGQFFNMAPYLATMIVLVAISSNKLRIKLSAPANLTKSFFKGR